MLLVKHILNCKLNADIKINWNVINTIYFNVIGML